MHEFDKRLQAIAEATATKEGASEDNMILNITCQSTSWQTASVEIDLQKVCLLQESGQT